MSLTLYTHIIPKGVSNRADTPIISFSFLKKVFYKDDGEMIVSCSYFLLSSCPVIGGC